MEAGKLDRRAQLLDSPATPDTNEYNEAAQRELVTATFWCEKVNGLGEEYQEAGRNGARVSYVLKARWRPDVFTDTRILLDGVMLNVAYTREIGRREGIEIYCTESKAI